MGAFIIIIAIIAVVGVAVVLTVIMKAKKDTSTTDGGIQREQTTGELATTAQNFLPFEDISDSMIDLGNDQYRMLVEVSSINYYMRSEEEQDVVESSFSRAITGWNFPFAFYIQTREVDNRALVRKVKEESKEVASEFPSLEEYAEKYGEYVEEATGKMGQGKTKKKYIIVSCDEASKMQTLTPAERREYSFDMLYQRCSQVINSLKGIGIYASIINTQELAQVVFQAINKRSGGAIDGLVSGDFLSGLVEGDERYRTNKGSRKREVLLEEFINELKVNVSENKSTPRQERLETEKLITELIHLQRTGEVPEIPNDYKNNVSYTNVEDYNNSNDEEEVFTL